MPNPLSRVKPNAGFILATVGHYPLRQNEHLATLAMEGISTWANVDLNMLQLYLTLAGGLAKEGATVFLSLESDGAKKPLSQR